MQLTTLKTAPHVPSDLDGYIMHKSGNLQIIHLCLQPGETVAPHSNPVDVVACLISGEVMLLHNEEQIAMNTFDTAEVKAGVQRGFVNNSGSEARLLMVKKLG